MKSNQKSTPRIILTRGSSGGGGVISWYDENIYIGDYSNVNCVGIGIEARGEGSQVVLYVPPASYAPFFSIGSASVSGPSYTSYYVSTDNVGNIYGEGGWDNQAPHPCTRNTTIQYVNAGICTHLEAGTVTAQVNYYDAANVLQAVTNVVTLDGTAKDVTVTGVRIEVYGLVVNGSRKEGFIRTTITMASLPGWGTGGRISSFFTTHLYSATSYTFSNATGVFEDVRPTPPTITAPPVFSLVSPDPLRNFATVLLNSADYGWLSGIPHLKNGAVWKVQCSYTQVYNDTYILNPYDYDFSSVGAGTGSVQYNDPSITGVSVPPKDNDTPTSIDLNKPTAGSGTCVNGSCSNSMRVSDPWGNSGYIPSNALSPYRVFNRVSASSNTYEDFRSEAYRQLATANFDSGPIAMTGLWDSIITLGAGDAQDDLCGRLIRPSIDYTTYVPSGRNYSAGFNPVTYYYRFFSQAGSYSNGSLIINGTYTSLFLKVGAVWDGTPAGGSFWVNYDLPYDFLDWNNGNPTTSGCRGVGNAWTIGSLNISSTVGPIKGLWVRIGMSAGDILTDITCTFL